MNNSFAKDFANFLHSRTNWANHTLEANADYQRNMCELDDISADAFNLADEAINMAEDYAYKQGFLDGLSIITALKN